MTLVSPPCVICGGTRFAPVYASTVQEGSDPARYFSSSRVEVGHHAIVRCADCDLVQSRPRDDDATLAHTYASLEDRAYDGEELGRLRVAEAHLAFVADQHRTPGRILDVGCATGALAQVAAKAGWEVTGLEPSAWAIERAKERCPSGTFVQGLVQEVDFPEGHFDVVTLWDTLEHVPDPRSAIARLRRWIRPGGWLFVNVPNVESWTAKALGSRWVLLLREHLWYFSPNTMAKLLVPIGFEIVETRPNFVTFSFSTIAGRVGQYPGPVGRMGRRLARRRQLEHLRLRFPIGEMSVATRRIDAPSREATSERTS
jgi:2-polyprenyl-3-methyl-5-hydroxy-6-metoxy-1,4-benzoquinol methylase